MSDKPAKTYAKKTSKLTEPPPEAGGSGGSSLRAGTADQVGPRLGVRKTYKLYVGGAFPRSESGRSYPVRAAKSDELLAFAAQASRKDVRDAVVAARAAVGKVTTEHYRLEMSPSGNT